MPRKSKISVVDYSAGSEKGERTQSGSQDMLCPPKGRSLGGQLVKGSKNGGEPSSPHKPSAPSDKLAELPNADSPDFAAWAAQRNETGRE